MGMNDHAIARDGTLDFQRVDKGAVEQRRDKELARLTQMKDEHAVREEELNTRESTLDRREAELGQALAAIKTRESDVALREADVARKLEEVAAAAKVPKKATGPKPVSGS